MFLILGRTLNITKGMLKVMCARRIVEKPELKWKNLNRSIREIPVTISAFIIGILVMAVSADLNFELRPTMAIQATVPIMVEKMVARIAMESVLTRALATAESEKSCLLPKTFPTRLPIF